MMFMMFISTIFWKNMSQKSRHSHSPQQSHFVTGRYPPLCHGSRRPITGRHPRHQRMCNVASASSPSPRHAWQKRRAKKTRGKYGDFFTQKPLGIFNQKSYGGFSTTMGFSQFQYHGIATHQILEWILKIHNILDADEFIGPPKKHNFGLLISERFFDDQVWG